MKKQICKITMMGLIVALAAIPIDYWAQKAYGHPGDWNPNLAHACRKNGNGMVRIIFKNRDCITNLIPASHPNNETRVHWNVNPINDSNTVIGNGALQASTTSTANTAIGVNALKFNTAGYSNTAVGFNALLMHESGYKNTAVGNHALENDTNGTSNTAIGYKALSNNNDGIANTAIGAEAGPKIIAASAGVSFDFGASAGPLPPRIHSSLSNTTAIGAGAKVDQDNKVRLGNELVSVIEGQVPFTFVSDKNQKENFQPVDGMEVLRKLREFNLTSWNYIGNDPQKIRHYGPMAQDFYAAFGKDNIGTIGTPTTINSGDMGGILMIAVQELEKQKTAQSEQIKQLISDNARLREQVNSQSTEIDYLKANMAESKAENVAFKTRLDRISQMMGIHDMTQAVLE